MSPGTTQPNRSQLAKGKHSEQGFTLIESLMAMIIIAITVIAITPPIFLSVATRIQNQRSEQAMQLAQRHVDRIRVLLERGAYTDADLPPQGGTGLATAVAAPGTFAPLTSASSCTPPTDVSTASACDVNGDNKPDFYVQAFRTREVRSGTPPQIVAFNMGVRVYAAVAANNPTNLQTEPATLKFTTEQGNQRNRPLAVMYTQVVRSDLKDSLRRYEDFLNQS